MTAIVQLIAALAPTVTNLILHLKNGDGSTTIVAMLSAADSANATNAANLAAFQTALGTAVPAKPTT
jgi:hypothetical protein